MKYGVIVCPKCRKSKGVLLSNKTTKCNRCGKTIILKKTTILYKTNSNEKLRQFIGVVNSNLNK